MPNKSIERKVGGDKIVVLVTCGSASEARKIARALIEGKLAACVNLLSPPVESIYRWNGKIASAKEFLLIIKTTRKRYAAIQTEILRFHSYEVPEIIALPIVSGLRRYLDWVSGAVAPQQH